MAMLWDVLWSNPKTPRKTRAPIYAKQYGIAIPSPWQET